MWTQVSKWPAHRESLTCHKPDINSLITIFFRIVSSSFHLLSIFFAVRTAVLPNSFPFDYQTPETTANKSRFSVAAHPLWSATRAENKRRRRLKTFGAHLLHQNSNFQTTDWQLFTFSNQKLRAFYIYFRTQKQVPNVKYRFSFVYSRLLDP